MTVDIDKLRELLEKATPGEWSSDKFVDPGGGRSLGGAIKHIRVSTPVIFTVDGVSLVTAEQRDADAELIVSLHNAALDLLNELERLRRCIEVVRRGWAMGEPSSMRLIVAKVEAIMLGKEG